jgi:hypothetical protein
MDKKIRLSAWQAGWFGIALALCAVLLFIGGTGTSAQAGAAKVASPNVTCPAGQCFTDVPPGNGFFDYVNNLYMDGIIGGYPCGGTGEPCDADNRPYYRPANLVSRQQMTKFVDLGRRNIADAIGISLHLTDTTGISLVLSNTTTDSIDAYNSSGAEAIQSICTQANQNCWAFYSSAATGDYAAVLSGGRGVSTSSSDDGYSALRASASGSGGDSYGLNATSDNYRAGYVKSSQNGLYTLYVDTQDGPGQGTAGLEVNGSTRMEGNLYVAGSKAGYVVDIMQNSDTASLEAGDVVTIVGNSSPVLGEIPVVNVKKANTAYDTGIVGVVDQVMYVPDGATKAAYDKQEAAIKAAMQQRADGMANAAAIGTKFDPSTIIMPDATITDEQGVMHADTTATQVGTNGYISVATLGSYKGVKVDASFGAVHAGDLLVASTHAGYAMKATDKTQTSGAVIGKALGNLETGTGLVPVMVTLK